MQSTAASCQVHSSPLSPGYGPRSLSRTTPCQHCHEAACDFRSRAEDEPP